MNYNTLKDALNDSLEDIMVQIELGKNKYITELLGVVIELESCQS